MPTVDVERQFWKRGRLRVAGVDEAGIGPLAGPVVAAACVIPVECEMIQDVRDSKTLSAHQRERLLASIQKQAVAIGLGAASPREVDRLNVLRASRLAMRRALSRVQPFDHALIDGREPRGWDPGPHTCVIDGDALCYAIACASIVAKVTRDHLMRRLALRYPGYGWERNAGYGTPEHLAALRQLGVTPLHRRTYAPVRFVCEADITGDCADAGDARGAARLESPESGSAMRCLVGQST